MRRKENLGMSKFPFFFKVVTLPILYSNPLNFYNCWLRQLLCYNEKCPSTSGQNILEFKGKIDGSMQIPLVELPATAGKYFEHKHSPFLHIFFVFVFKFN